MSETKITIDVANVEPVLEIISRSYEAAQKFVNKVDAGKARSIETYADMKKLMQMIQALQEGKSNEARETFASGSVEDQEEESRFSITIVGNEARVDMVGTIEEVLKFIMKSIDALKGIARNISGNDEEIYNQGIEEMIQQMKKPFGGKIEVV